MPTRKKNAPPPNGASLKKVKEDQKPGDVESFPIVGIGASAGGLETLNVFFSGMPPDRNMAFVVIQHLSPHHKSIMVSLLEKHTRMQVKEIEDGMKLEPDHVYLNPPGKNVAVFNGTLHLMEPVKSTTINLPIDFFFRSLSEDRHEKAIGIILSGTASDGTLGVRAIKGEGGMVMVQEPDTAKYDGMPKSAIETGLVDFIVPVEKMPEILIRYVEHPFMDALDKVNVEAPPVKTQIQKVLALIRSATGNDFSHYKPSTIARRIERRLAVHQITALSDYILYLQKNPGEIDALFKNLVIGVTSFFRDNEAYDLLSGQALPALLTSKSPDAKIRVWVAGCSTGEEAYSLGMILSELMDTAQKPFSVQIFATDIDPSALDTARKGVYPESISADVSKARLNRFFIKESGFFKVNKALRDMVVFSLQNVIKDPPFSHLDLVSCRNLMIYMDGVLQKKMIPLFHYTLNPGGILFLGTSESIGENRDFFHPINSKWKIFERKTGVSGGINDFTPGTDYPAAPKIESRDKNNLSFSGSIQEMAEKAILDEYAPAGVLVNDQYEIVHFVGQTEKFLVPPTGRPVFNILSMAREDLKPPLTTSLHKAFREKTNVFLKGLRIRYKGSFCMADLSVKRMKPGFMLVIFEDKTPEVDPKEPQTLKPEKTGRDVEHLEQELQSTREYLQATIEELETSNEELKSTNEELQSVNEELQSTNEELETSKEELQSTNEELATVNAELQNKVDEFSKTTDDMSNLLASTEIATIFLDTDLRIKRFTPAAAKIVSLIQTDVGRPLDDLRNRFPDVNLAGLGEKVLSDLNTVEMEILSKDATWYALKVLPYRTTGNVIDGVVMTFLDIHTLKQANKVRRLATVLEDANDAITVLDTKGRILAWNQGAHRMYGWTEAEALKMNYSAFLPKDRKKEFGEIVHKLSESKTVRSYKTQRMTKDGRILNIWLTASVLTDNEGRLAEMAITERDLAWLTEKEDL
jgi:two-component system CheB/CheR fusion protein